MKKVNIISPNEIKFEENAAKPKLEKGFALIEVKACAICSTDLEVVEGRIAANYPITLGHEWAGKVVAVSDKKYNKWIGKRVTGSNDIICGECEACKKGDWRYCPDFKEVGFKHDGGYAEYMTVPEHGLVKLPDFVPFKVAALAEPLGVACGCLFKSHIKKGESLLIYGAGAIGLSLLVAAKYSGITNIGIIDLSQKRLDLAKEMGATYTICSNNQDEVITKVKENNPCIDVVIDATGIESCIQTSLKLPRKGGKVVLAGYGRGKVMNIRVDDIHINNLKVIGAGNNWNMHQKAINIMKKGGYKEMSLLISEEIKLEDYELGLKLTKEKPEGFMKAVFVNE